MKASNQYLLGNNDQALKHYEDALKLESDHYQALMNIGVILAKTGREREAIPYYKKAALKDPTLYGPYKNLGDIFSTIGELDQAIAHYLRALQLQPGQAETHFNLGKVLTNRGYFEEAKEHFMVALALAPDRDKKQNDLLTVLRILNEIDRLKEGVETHPEDPDYPFQLGVLFERHRRVSEAITYYTMCLERNPNHVKGLTQLGLIHLNQGDLEQAEKYLLKAAQVSGQGMESLYNLACLYSVQNQKDLAVSFLKSAIEKGFNAWNLLQTDKDLSNLRETEYYHSLVERLKHGGQTQTGST